MFSIVLITGLTGLCTTVGGLMAVVLTESQAVPDRVADVLERLLKNPETLRVMGECARQVAQPDAAAKIAARVLSVGSGL